MKKDPALTTAPTIQVIERMFSLIDVLASREEAISLKEISQKTGLHPSTAHRILNDLATGRFVDRPEAGTYRLGMRLLELGNLVKGRLNVRDAALTPMRDLHKLIQQPVNLSMRQGDEIVYIERAYSERSGMQVVRAIGGRAPLHLTSVGKLFLAADDPLRVRSYATRTGLGGQTRNSITQLQVLERELSRVNQSGFARDNEELELGVRCIAAGIYDDQGKLLKYKARLCGRGFKEIQGIDYDEVYSPTVKHKLVRAIVAIGASKEWNIYQDDCKAAYLNALLQKGKWLKLPDGRYAFITKCLYGLKKISKGMV
jgi:DNA-binding IclR family transcriptional regulator